MVDWRTAARSAIRLYRKTGVTYEEANRAATLIKAAYKGYYTRRFMRKLAEESKQLSEVIEDNAEGEGETSEHDVKNVKIDFGSLIPHVGFDEQFPQVVVPTEIVEQESSQESIKAAHSVIQTILDSTFQHIGKTEQEVADGEEMVNIEEIQPAEVEQPIVQAPKEGELQSETPEQLQGEPPEPFQGEFPEQHQIESPEQSNTESPEQLNGESSEQPKIESPEQLQSEQQAEATISVQQDVKNQIEQTPPQSAGEEAGDQVKAEVEVAKEQAQEGTIENQPQPTSEPIEAGTENQEA